MLNLTLVQKLDSEPLSAFQNVHHQGSKNFDIQSCVSTSKEKSNTVQPRSDSNWQLSTHFPLDHIDSSESLSNSVLYLAEHWMWDTVFLFFETENWMWLLRHYLNFLYELNLIGQ